MLEDHLEGFKGFAYTHVCKDIDPIYVISRISFVNLAIGCVINQEFDEQGKVINFLKEFNKSFNSLLFYDDKIFDYDDQVLAELVI